MLEMLPTRRLRSDPAAFMPRSGEFQGFYRPSQMPGCLDVRTARTQRIVQPIEVEEIDMSRFFSTGTALATALAALTAGDRLATAQDRYYEKYPSRPVKIVVPLPAGSPPDVRTRFVAEQL